MKGWMRKAGVLLMVTALAACDDPHEPHPGDDVAFMQLVIGTQTVTVNSSGGLTGGPVVIPAGGATIAATFLNINNQAVALSTNDFRFDVDTDASGRLTFARTGPWGGTLTRNAAGAATLSVSLFHIDEGHDEFGPFNVAVTVQ